jgi:acetoacetyl-CoA synthetase
MNADDQRTSECLWVPSQDRVEQAGITRYLRWLRDERRLEFDDYEQLWRWSVRDLERSGPRSGISAE